MTKSDEDFEKEKESYVAENKYAGGSLYILLLLWLW